jgi:hypothetical protein
VIVAGKLSNRRERDEPAESVSGTDCAYLVAGDLLVVIFGGWSDY